MVLRIIYAINFYQHHKSKYTQTGWECEWEEEQSKWNTLNKKKHKFANFQNGIFRELSYAELPWHKIDDVKHWPPYRTGHAQLQANGEMTNTKNGDGPGWPGQSPSPWHNPLAPAASGLCSLP